jgi:IS5 family transposase
VGIDLGRERVPDATTLLKFRKLLNEQKLGEALFAKVGQQLQERGFKVNTGTIVDATIIAAPSSTKNADKARDPDMHQTRKGQQWYFGMKLHIGVDSQSGLAHSAVVTAANVHDKHPLPNLLHGNERRVYGDSAYASQKALIASKAPKAKDFTNQRTRRAGEVDEVQRAKNRNKSRVRARVEHVFAVVKRLWGFTKVRYRGLQKNATRAFTALALANIYLQCYTRRLDLRMAIATVRWQTQCIDQLQQGKTRTWNSRISWISPTRCRRFPRSPSN